MATHTTLYKSVWYWDAKTMTLDNQKLPEIRSLKSKTGIEPTNVWFLENVDRKQQAAFKKKYQRKVNQLELCPSCLSSNVSASVVTLQDIKDVVTFLMMCPIPCYILDLLHSYKSNQLYRALIIYFQVYLQVWDDLRYRNQMYAKNRLKHPSSVKNEALCSRYLSILRTIIGHRYAVVLTGSGIYKKFHHMNNCMNQSNTSRDVEVYEYLFKFAARVVWIALLRRNYKEIESEMSRLFSYYLPISADRDHRVTGEAFLTSENDEIVLYGKDYNKKTNMYTMSPVVDEVFKMENTKACLNLTRLSDENGFMSGLSALLNIPEEMLQKLGLTLGILGQPRDSFEPTLYLKQGPGRGLEEGDEEVEIGSLKDKASAVLPSGHEKPSDMVHKLLGQLVSTVDLNKFAEDESSSFAWIKEEMRFFNRNHLLASKLSYKMWKATKRFR